MRNLNTDTRMKKVLFDGIACQYETKDQFHGGAEYSRNLLREALDKGYVFDIVLFNNYYTDDELSKLLKKMPPERVHNVDNKAQLYNLIDSEGFERFFSVLPYPYYDYPCKAQLVGVIHGLRKVELPWDENAWRTERRPWVRFVGKHFPKHMARKIQTQKLKEFQRLISLPNVKLITVSDHTKYALLNYFPSLKPRDIRVYYSPFSVNGLKPAPMISDYFLMLNANRYEKNIYRAIKTFDRLFSDGRLKGRRVVVTGCQRINLRRAVKNKDRFMFMNNVPIEELRKYYSEAFCLVYPSLNEGFGYPPLKAMACEVPVIASTAASIPEVCASAALYFSPTNSDDLANRILQIDLNEDLRARLVYEGKKRLDQLLKRQAKEIDQELQFIFGPADNPEPADEPSETPDASDPSTAPDSSSARTDSTASTPPTQEASKPKHTK